MDRVSIADLMNPPGTMDEPYLDAHRWTEVERNWKRRRRKIRVQPKVVGEELEGRGRSGGGPLTWPPFLLEHGNTWPFWAYI